MKYKIGQKVQTKRDLIRCEITAAFEQEDTKYWVQYSNVVKTHLESELELTPDERLLSFILRAWYFIKSDWLISAIVFGSGILGGLII